MSEDKQTFGQPDVVPLSELDETHFVPLFIGIALFFAAVGLDAGARFFATGSSTRASS